MGTKIIPTASNSMNKVIFALRRGLFVMVHFFISHKKLSRANTFISVLTVLSIIHVHSSTGLNVYLPTACTSQHTPAFNPHSNNLKSPYPLKQHQELSLAL